MDTHINFYVYSCDVCQLDASRRVGVKDIALSLSDVGFKNVSFHVCGCDGIKRISDPGELLKTHLYYCQRCDSKKLMDYAHDIRTNYRSSGKKFVDVIHYRSVNFVEEHYSIFVYGNSREMPRYPGVTRTIDLYRLMALVSKRHLSLPASVMYDIMSMLDDRMKDNSPTNIKDIDSITCMMQVVKGEPNMYAKIAERHIVSFTEYLRGLDSINKGEPNIFMEECVKMAERHIASFTDYPKDIYDMDKGERTTLSKAMENPLRCISLERPETYNVIAQVEYMSPQHISIMRQKARSQGIIGESFRKYLSSNRFLKEIPFTEHMGEIEDMIEHGEMDDSSMKDIIGMRRALKKEFSYKSPEGGERLPLDEIIIKNPCIGESLPGKVGARAGEIVIIGRNDNIIPPDEISCTGILNPRELIEDLFKEIKR